MGKCKFCNENAGFFNHSHEVCRTANDTAIADSIADLAAGRMPKMIGDFPIQFNVSKTEKFIRAFACDYVQLRTRTEYVGAAAGVSFRVAKGISIRTGGFRGIPIEKGVASKYPGGVLAVTSRNLYFMAPGKSLRIPYTKIVSFTAYTDAVGIHRDGPAAKPEVFMVEDGTYLYDVIKGAAGL